MKPSEDKIFLGQKLPIRQISITLRDKTREGKTPFAGKVSVVSCMPQL